MISRVLLAVMVSLQVFAARAQTEPIRSGIVDLPRGALTRIASPDGRWTLIFECPNNCTERKLWIVQSETRTRRMVREFERSLSISWSPNSRAFFINDDLGSNESECYVYDAATLKATNLADVVVAKYASTRQYLTAGHSYLRARRWASSHELLVTLFGHFDEPPSRGFTLRYRVNLNGTVQRVSRSSEENQ
jgi:hypothetical protein